MTANALAELELSRWNWSQLRAATGDAGKVPDALSALLKSSSPEDAETAYWGLENHVVVQGQLFEAAVHVVSVLLAALVWPERPRWVRIGVLELLFQIVSGDAHESEVAAGRSDLGEACRIMAREGLWVLYRELLDGERAAARDVIEVIENDSDRLLTILATFE